MVVRSQPPARYPSGVQTDPPYGPLAASGMANPFFYHQFYDDFSPYDTSIWTATNDSTGTVAATPGDGGLVLFTTAATSADYESLHVASAGWTLPGTSTAKMFFLTRLRLSDVTVSSFIAGLTNSTGVPGSVTDGIYFTKTSSAGGATTLALVYNVGGTAVSTAIPLSAYTLANATNIDLAWSIDALGNLNAFVGAQLVGWIPQSGTGAVNSAGVPTLPVLGKCLQINTPTLSTANLTPFLSVTAGAAAAKTMTVDFVAVQKQR